MKDEEELDIPEGIEDGQVLTFKGKVKMLLYREIKVKMGQVVICL